ncbi:MAG: transcription antitermination factor NusB [Polyangia bacterium]
MSSAREVALRVLDRVERGGAFAAAALEAELAGLDDSRDSALATELVYGVLRRRSWLDRLLESASRRGLRGLEPSVLNALRLGAYQIAFLERIPARAAVFETVSQVKRGRAPGLAGLTNALLRRLAARPREELLPPAGIEGQLADLAARLGLPSWLLERWIAERGRKGAAELARAFARPAPRAMRVNAARASREELLARYRDRVRAGRLSPWALEVDDAELARRLDEAGLAVHQDEGAQLVALAVEARPGDRVLDACAGRGGKTGALAALIGADLARERLLAVDVGRSKLERSSFELERLGLGARTATIDLARDPQQLEGEFDRVLLDAPCSGSGTLGRRPEIRWRLDPAALERLVEIQDSLLEAVIPRLAPGGRLVYAVCSLLTEEGAGHLEPLLGRHPEMEPVAETPDGWPEIASWSDGRFEIDPARTGGDGYTGFCVRRSRA